jgi:plasmid stabilization system protein ParE
MTYRIHVNAAAIADMQAIHAYLDESSPKAAQRLLGLFEASIEALADFPKRYPVAPESSRSSTEIRHLPVGNYRILYIIIGETVQVLRIRHSAQPPMDPKNLN